MRDYDTFKFDFEKIKNFLKNLDTVETINYLKWIIKEYNLAERPKKEIKLTYRISRFIDWDSPDSKLKRIPHSVTEDKFFEKINIELKFHEDQFNNKYVLKEKKEKLTKNVEKLNGIIKNKIFICYSHEDKLWLVRVKKHIKALQLEGINVEEWDDTKLKGGDEWKKEIEKSLEQSYIAILLISVNFLASDFIVKNELPKLLVNAEKKLTIIKALIIDPCRFKNIGTLSKYQSVNDPEKEVLSELKKPTQERIFVKLMDEIDNIIKTNI